MSLTLYLYVTVGACESQGGALFRAFGLQANSSFPLGLYWYLPGWTSQERPSHGLYRLNGKEWTYYSWAVMKVPTLCSASSDTTPVRESTSSLPVGVWSPCSPQGLRWCGERAPLYYLAGMKVHLDLLWYHPRRSTVASHHSLAKAEV